jgi:hypothetical protein
MVKWFVRISIPVAAFLVMVLSGPSARSAQGGLKTINPPQGGKIIYGQVTGESTEAGAMGAVLRSLHQSLGEKPQVGKLFDVRGTDSIATFFNVTRHDQGAGKGPLQVSGLLIVTKVSTDHVEAALVSDDAARFPKTLAPMMKTLMSAWHPLAGADSAGSGASGAPAAQLHQVATQDRSASIGLPSGWQLVPNMSMMGSLVAQGPNGESAEMGITFLAGDTNNPKVQQLMRTLQNGGLRNTSYASATYYPYGADQAKTFVDLIQGVRRKAGLQPAVYNLTSATPVPANSQQHCTHLKGTVDFSEGKGPRELNALYCVNPPGPAGNWMSSAYMTSVPQQFAGTERATLGAIMQSFQVDQAMVQQQANQIAAPVIAQIHAIGQASAAAAQAAHQREDIHNSSVYQHWDSMDKRGQEFENYQLGYAVVSDAQNTAHGTLWADDAAALVQSNPDRFEYVSAPNYWKGIDY